MRAEPRVGGGGSLPRQSPGVGESARVVVREEVAGSAEGVGLAVLRVGGGVHGRGDAGL